MNSVRNLILILLICLLLPVVSSAQDPTSTIDTRLIDVLKKELQMPSDQYVLLDSLVQKAAEEIALIEAEKMKVQRETEDEEFLITQLKVLNQQIKDIREIRDLDIVTQLNPEQLKIYNEKIKPQKPQVLHFGLHNRADCKVCDK